ncbi:hypothetical protein J2X46_002693 [Nocardioides sp. BE266]|uniref:hypothetical protein n=1 Tax=Nocardioides sp. BE266 TaxID=2817725 RepID=UPI002856049E|nr:hypothetical protein [Nocardioides sp. BE266]MDR7253703.1 hypothetical protein [Nocardioides sp. BE266]
MTINPGHGITLGGLVLVEDGQPYEHAEGFTTEVSADGTTWGNPDVVVAQIISALSAGDLVRETHVGNREPVLHVRITGATANDLALGEKALAAEMGKPIELVWQPPDVFAPPTVFDVLHARMDWEFDDLSELRVERAYIVTMTALPRGRGDTLISTPAISAVAPSVVDSGSSTTNWAALGPAGATLSVVSGAVRLTYNGALPYGFFSGAELQRTAAISTSTDKYLGLDWKTSAPGIAINVAINSGSIGLTEVRREPAPTASFSRSWFKVPDAVTSITDFRFYVRHAAAAGTQTFEVDQVLKANALPASGTTREKNSVIVPKGSVPTEGNVLVQHETGGLGVVSVFSHQAGSGYNPSMRPWTIISDTPTTDSTTVSGARQTLTGLTRYAVPVASIPEGDVHLWARLRTTSGTGNALINYAARSLMAGVSVGDEQAGGTYVNLPTLNAWVMAPIARLTLPTSRIGPSGFIYVDLQRDFTSSGLTVEIDQGWLYAMDKGQLTVVDCGTGTPAVGTVHNRLRITAPSLEAPTGAIEVATQADWSDAYTPTFDKILCDQRSHQFDPNGGSMVLTVTTVADANTSFEHYPRAHSNVGDF